MMNEDDNQTENLSANHFKHICNVPDYQAARILLDRINEIDHQKSAIDSILMKNLLNRNSFKRHFESIKIVQKSIIDNLPLIYENWDDIRLNKLAKELQSIGLSSKEITLVLNRMPTDTKLIELMFQEKLTTSQITSICHLIQQYISV